MQCMGDPFCLGLPGYTIRNRIDEAPCELIDDGFFSYLSRQKSDSDLTDRLTKLVARLKISPQERKDYIAL